MTSLPLLLSVRQAAQEIGLGRDRTYELVHQGRLRALAYGRRLVIPRSECEAFVRRELDREEVITTTDTATQSPPGPGGRLRD